MRNKNIAKKLTGLALSAVMLLSSNAIAFAESPATGANIGSQTIPVIASNESYYEISMPAGLDGSGNIHLTKDYNAYVTADGDTASTFYGYTTVGIKGTIGDTQKVNAALTCADLVNSTDSTSTAPVGMQALTDASATKISTIWDASATDAIRSTNAVAFGSSAWTNGTTGLSSDFTSLEQDTVTKKYFMLRTTLPKDGTYTSNLVINFSLQDA